MSVIYLLRHGQTVWNLEKRMQGQQDSPLTMIGITQVMKMGITLDKLEAWKHRIYASPLPRTRQSVVITCAEMGRHYGECIYDKRLLEHSFGIWEGKRWKDIIKQYPGMKEERESDHWNFTLPNGDSYESVSKRTGEFLNEHTGKDMIIIAHEIVNKTIIGNYCGYDKEKIVKIKHPQDTIYKLEGGFLFSIKCY